MTDLGTIVASPLEEVAPPKGRHGAAAWAVWIARRLGLAVLTLFLVSVLVFLATAALGDPVRAILGRDYNANPGRVAELEAMLNSDQSLVSRYFDWLGGLLTGDLGTSLASGQPVSELIKSPVENSAVLVPDCNLPGLTVDVRRRWPRCTRGTGSGRCGGGSRSSCRAR